MQILEQFSEGKRNQETNEDAIIATNNFAAIIDGATTKSDTRVREDTSNGRYSAALIKEVIKGLPKDVTCDFFCRQATETIKKTYIRYGIYNQVKCHATERLTSSVIVYSLYRNEIWMIGDCQAYANGNTYTLPKPMDSYLAEKRAMFIKERLAAGEKAIDFTIHDWGRDFILEELAKSCSLQNTEKIQQNSFSVIDGFDVNMSLVKIVKLPNETKEIVLASDGYPILLPTLKETEQKLKKILETDPLCIGEFKSTKCKMKGLKSFDDRSYIKIKR